MKAKILVSAVANVGLLNIGFRKVAAHNAAIGSLEDFFTAEFTTGAYSQQSDIAGTPTATNNTDFNQTDGTVADVEILVSAAGLCTVKIGGVDATAATAFSFADGIALTPFIHYVRAGNTTASTVTLQELECGLEAGRGNVYA